MRLGGHIYADYETPGAWTDALDDLPLLVEHLDSAEAYEQAAQYVRSVADELGVDV